MQLAVFGASGRTGRLLVGAALIRGHEVSASSRRPPDPPFDGSVRVLIGDARDPEHVRMVVDGADAVVSVMAIREGTEPTTDLSDATRSIVEVLRTEGPSRVVVAANASVFHDRPVDPPFGIVADEHRRNVALLRTTPDLEWTVVAPMFLTDGSGTGYTWRIDARAPGRGLDRSALAAAVLDAVDRDDWVGHLVGVSGD